MRQCRNSLAAVRGPGGVGKGMKVIIIGAGGHAKVVIATAQAAGYTVSGLYDDDPDRRGCSVLGLTVLGTSGDIDVAGIDAAVLAIGNAMARRRLAQELKGLAWITLIHPAATVHETVRLGPGSVVFAGSVIQPDVELGAHVIVNSGASIDHDSKIGDFVHIAPGARLAGNVRVGEGSLVGIGSCVVPNTRIGDWSIIGAGAAVIDDIPDGVFAAGVPARILKRLDK